ncbi:MAG: PAS domain S-box protein, partial [Bacillota bacterium]
MKKSTSYKNKTKAELIKELEELRSEKEFSRKSLKPGEDERSRELAELLPIVTFELDTDGMITYLNRKGFETFQFSAEDFQDGLHVLTCIAPERRHYTGSNVSRLLNGEKLLVSEQLAQRKDGTVFPAITHSSPIYHNGQIIGIRGILIDVTKEKKAEEALRKSEEKYRRFFEEDLSGISVSDINGNILECNNSFVKLFKYKSIKDAKSVNAFDYYVRKEDRMKLLNIIMYTKRFFNYELQMKNVRGEIFDVIMNVEGLFEDGRLMGIRTYIFDNTERKKAQEELKQREEIFRGLFENSSASMMIFDPKDASYKYVNQAACNFYGYSKEELLKMSIRDLSITPQEKIKDKISEVLQNNSFHFTFQHRLSNSELRDVEVYGNKIFIGGKELIFEIIHDITERQKAEKELEEYKTQLEKIIEERTAKLVEVNEKLIHEIQRLNVAEERIQDQFRFLLTLMDNIPVPIYIQNVKG